MLATEHANSQPRPDNPARGIFVIGTDTEVGKTHSACLIASHWANQGYCVGVYKPVASGISDAQPSDASLLLAASGQAWPIERVSPQSFSAPLAPPIAAAREGKSVCEQTLIDGARWWSTKCNRLIIESAGGALSPISSHWTSLDLAKRLGYPLLLVAGHKLGMINHTLLTLEAARARGLDIRAIVVNQHLSSTETSEVRLAETLALLRSFAGETPILSQDHRPSSCSPQLIDLLLPT